MDEKGNHMINPSVTAAEDLQTRLKHLGDIRLKKMFGGHGIFESETMFALVEKNGRIYFKVDQSNLEGYVKAGSNKHSRMPYYQIPESVLEDQESLLDWAASSISISKKPK